AVLSPHRQAPGDARIGDRHRLPRNPVLDFRTGERCGPSQPAGAARATRRGREDVADGARPRLGNETRLRAARAEPRHCFRRRGPGRLRAAADGRRPRRPDAVHAPRRSRGSVGVDRPHHRRMDSVAAAAAPLSGGKLGARGRERAPGARRPPLARSRDDLEGDTKMGWTILWWVLGVWAVALAMFTLVLW